MDLIRDFILKRMTAYWDDFLLTGGEKELKDFTKLFGKPNENDGFDQSILSYEIASFIALEAYGEVNEEDRKNLDTVLKRETTRCVVMHNYAGDRFKHTAETFAKEINLLKKYYSYLKLGNTIPVAEELAIQQFRSDN